MQDFETLIFLLGRPLVKPEGIPEGVSMWFKGGSSYVCNPPVTDTDEDYFYYSRFMLTPPSGFVRSSADRYDGEEGDTDAKFTSYRKGAVNIIQCKSRDTFYATLKASILCKRLNLQEKNQRILVHELIRDFE